MHGHRHAARRQRSLWSRPQTGRVYPCGLKMLFRSSSWAVRSSWTSRRSSAEIRGSTPVARECNSSWSSNIARPSWAFIWVLPVVWILISSLSLHYQAELCLVKFEASSLPMKRAGWRLVSVLGGAGGPAADRTEGQAGPRQQQQPTDQDRPYGEGQEQRIVEIVFGEAEKGH